MKINNFKELIEAVAPHLETKEDFSEEIQSALADYINRAEEVATTALVEGLSKNDGDGELYSRIISGLLQSAVSQVIDIETPLDVIALKSNAFGQGIAAAWKLAVGMTLLEGYTLTRPEASG